MTRIFTRYGAWEEIRTPDLRITNALLYRLSYPGATRKTTRFVYSPHSRASDNMRSANNNDSSIFVDKRSLVSIRISMACIDDDTR
jgi:hypothetical protein